MSPRHSYLTHRRFGAVVAVATMVVTAGVLGPSAASSSRPSSAGVESWVTDLSTDQRLAARPRIDWRSGVGRPGATIVVDPTRRYQKMVGFGASMTDSSAYVLSQLPARVRRQAMRELFSPTEGIGLSVLRQPMGASDFAVGQAYSYDDQPKGETDRDLSEFSIRHDRAYILPRLREAYALNPRLSFMASPWSAPGWMKTTDSMIGGSLQERYHRAYADYFVKFIKAYRRAGIPTDYVTMQNEPLYTPPDYPGMLVWPDQAATFIGRHLGPALDRAGLDSTEILGYDHNWDITDYAEAMYADRRAARHVVGTAWHCYAGGVVAQSVSHNNYPHAQAFQTECSGGEWQYELGDPFALTMASVIKVPRNWGQSVVLWNLALDEQNGPFIGGCKICRGVVTVNDNDTVAKELEYWALGHASKFVRPGAARIGSSSLADRITGEGLTNVAFANRDGSHVLIAHNAGSSTRSFDIEVGGRHVTTTLAPGAAATYRWTAPKRPSPAAYLGWADLDYGRGPAGTPGGRLVASVSPEVVNALSAVRLGTQWLSYSLPYGAQLVSGQATVLPRTGWRLRPSEVTPVKDQPPEAMIDGDPKTRWSSGEGQSEKMSLQIDLGREQTFTEIVLDAERSIGDYLRRYAVQVSADGATWTDVAAGPGKAGVMVIALPATTTRYLRILSTASSGSWWSIHELNLRNAAGAGAPGTPGRGLVQASGELPDGTAVRGYRNSGRRPAEVPWPIPGLGYTYVLPPTAAVTFAVSQNGPQRPPADDDLARARNGP